jgi:hypothetical protein
MTQRQTGDSGTESAYRDPIAPTPAEPETEPPKPVRWQRSAAWAVLASSQAWIVVSPIIFWRAPSPSAREFFGCVIPITFLVIEAAALIAWAGWEVFINEK